MVSLVIPIVAVVAALILVAIIICILRCCIRKNGENKQAQADIPNGFGQEMTTINPIEMTISSYNSLPISPPAPPSPHYSPHPLPHCSPTTRYDSSDQKMLHLHAEKYKPVNELDVGNFDKPMDTIITQGSPHLHAGNYKHNYGLDVGNFDNPMTEQGPGENLLLHTHTPYTENIAQFPEHKQPVMPSPQHNTSQYPTYSPNIFPTYTSERSISPFYILPPTTSSPSSIDHNIPYSSNTSIQQPSKAGVLSSSVYRGNDCTRFAVNDIVYKRESLITAAAEHPLAPIDKPHADSMEDLLGQKPDEADTIDNHESRKEINNIRDIKSTVQ
ncbi:uncharacterized protein VTP21DRAFT_521 [Calcarisporiella thermophila]|uniref:uncharacterized protein n=1 Tax=Calcarisporiella thermophila TaxID=911321 RepID=UPI0037435672